MSGESDIISSILTGLGWNDSLAVPIANEENKKLLHLIDLKQKQTLNNKNELDKLNEKLNSMSNHLKNCRQELQHSLQLRNAKIEQNKSEDHMIKVAEREIGRLKQENKKFDGKMKEITQTKNVFENNLFKKTTEIEELRTQMKWDQQALEAWLEESERKGDDILSMQKYARQDEAKIKEMNLELERLTSAINERRSKLEREVVETKTAQVELEKTSEEFRSCHEERETLLVQWEATIGQLKRRDEEIDHLSNKLALLRLEASKLEEALKARNEFYENLLVANREIDNSIDLVERQAGKLRMEQRDIETQRFNFHSELEALKRTCDRTAADLEQARVTISQLKKEKLEKEARKSEASQKRVDLEERLKRVVSDKLTAEQRANLADQMLEEQERNHIKFEQALKHTRDLQFKTAQELHDAEVNQRNISAGIQGNSTAIRNMNTSIHRLDHSLLKQQEILYNQDFSIQQLERRINRMQGDHSNEEKEALEERIKQLTVELEATVKVVGTLGTQLKRVQDDIRRCKYDMDKVNHQNARTTERLEEVNLQNETSQQELRKSRADKEKLMVEDNIMKLEVKRLRDRLYSKAEQVLSLDKRRLQLQQAIKERFAEIGIHKEMLQSQTRSAEDEKNKISCDLKSRISKIDKLEKRFEILTVSMAPPEGEEEQSQAYYVIKAAQDKEALQRQGDELDVKIRKAEKEIRALENTLILMNSCNQNYRQSMSKVTDTSAEQSTKNDLNIQLRTVMDKCNFKRKQLGQLEDDYQVLKETLENLNKDEVLYGDQVNGLLEQLMQKEKEKEKQMEKIERAENMIIRLRNEILESSKAEEFQMVEDDIKARDKKEFNRIAVNELLRCIQNHYPDIVANAKQYLEMGNLLTWTPPAASTRSSNAASSARSSLNGIQSAFTASASGSARSSIASSAAASISTRQSSRGPLGLNVVQMGFGTPASHGATVPLTPATRSIARSPGSSVSSSSVGSRTSKGSTGTRRGSRSRIG